MIGGYIRNGTEVYQQAHTRGGYKGGYTGGGIEARAYQLYRDICETVLRGVLQGLTAIYRVEVGQYVAVLLCVGIGEIKSPI